MQAAAIPALAGTKAEKETKRVEKVRTQIAKLGTGKDALVRVELRDKTKLEGYLSEVGADTFVVTVIGGMGSVMGAFLAALLIGELRAFSIR